jgi:transcriptional regulator
VAVHLTGQSRRLNHDALEPLLARLSNHFESQLHPKPIWTMEKMTDKIKTKMMRQIMPFRFEISELHSTWKLGQNKPEQVRLDAATALAEHVPVLAKLMKDPPQ